MHKLFRYPLAAGLLLAAFATPLLAEDESGGSTDRLDDAWAEQALAHPERDRGWSMLLHNDSNDDRVAYCEVREFAYPRIEAPLAIDGGTNSGMTVMGGDRDGVRILYRVLTRARSEARAQALAKAIRLERTKGWLRADGPPDATRGEWWAVEIKAWVPRSSRLSLRAHNGPMAVRDVRGTMDLRTVNGPMSLVDLGGAVQARTQNGPLHVALSGSHWDGTALDAEAENGPLNLVVPASYSARLVTGTIHGPSVFDRAIGSGRGRGWITTTLGNGGPLVRVVTTNGPFQITER